MGSRIVATGRAVPEKVLSNDELARIMDTSDEWIRTRTGITRRHAMRGGESLADLASAAARTALDRAGLKPSSIDAIVAGTVSSEYSFPSFACQVQQRLGV
ncbi:MAG TPA: 3-oxoacyl-ACP synthase, partial [Candidatus Binataceae bacterium]|nr:3-oxoacyl-ACP synthase [Candidatus Binataceae bacterium]